jgi:TolB-like protein/Flp pilus assembly protein TadD
VPEKFRELQWTRLPEGATSGAFVDHVRRLLAARDAALSGPSESKQPVLAPAMVAAHHAADAAQQPRRRTLLIGIAVAVVLLATGGVLMFHKRVPPAATTLVAATAAFSPPAHSIAVLPFVNMSEDPKQDYFSDGLAEELLNSLATVHDLQVAARTSSFSFKGKDTKLADIARELNVGAVLEGTVRKEGNHIRITAELINAVTGFDQWSQTYDRDLKNILSLQSEIATAVSKALQATLLPDAAATFELGGTRDTVAFDAYLQGEKLAGRDDDQSLQARIADYDEAIRRDPTFAKAYVGKSVAQAIFAGFGHIATYALAQQAAEQAVALAPDLGSAHTALGYALAGRLELAHSLAEHERALALSPGDSFVLQYSGDALTYVGRAEGLAVARRAVALDPLNALSHFYLGSALYGTHQYAAAIEVFDRALGLNPALGDARAFQGFAYSALGNSEAALKACLRPPLDINNYACLAISYRELGRNGEAQATLQHMRDTAGDAAAYQVAQVYAGWGEADHAIHWLETALRLRDPGLLLFRVDPHLDALRGDPRVQAIERALSFPD